MDVTFRFLGPEEGGVLTEAIEAAYGTTYDVRWVYDPLEVSAKKADEEIVRVGGRAIPIVDLKRTGKDEMVYINATHIVSIEDDS